MPPKISFAIPCYNKGAYIADVIHSIHELCDPLGGDYEICISDNGSDDLDEGLSDHLGQRNLLHNCRISRLITTISTQENWLYVLGMCSAPVVKLQLADDEICNFDIKSILSLFDDPEVGIVVGKTKPSFSVKEPSIQQSILAYYDTVNEYRRELFGHPMPQAKAQILIAQPYFKGGVSPFGDINALVMRRTCVDRLREPIFTSAFPAILCWPDWEIYMRLLLQYQSRFTDTYISEFNMNPSSPFVRSLSSPDFMRRVYSDVGATVRLVPFINPDIRRLLQPLLTRPQRAQLFAIALKQLWAYSGFSWRGFMTSRLINLLSPKRSSSRSELNRS